MSIFRSSLEKEKAPVASNRSTTESFIGGSNIKSATLVEMSYFTATSIPSTVTFFGGTLQNSPNRP